ncbi:MAG: DNA polymerase III, subunit gamma and tau [Nitrospirae bacterium RBG_19FT_COMBO_42_15]|nr:MAG: DNA polymerase III, subunit gamma and tau [Nitrospirae bacterium RBG_19FT_COMBO_42_15]
MEYQVSARKWRPQRFDDIIGQGHVTRTLQNAIKNNRIAHAYIFSGSRGVGKTTTARILAKALNCVNGPTPEPCNNCSPCKEITSGISTDVLEIDGASNTGVDDVRDLRESVKYSPMHGKYKVYIIDEVHMLSNSAFNALLKTLEEPPAHTIFVFATTEVHKIPTTVLSRCQHFNFKRLTLIEIVDRLRLIAEKDSIEINDNGLAVIAKAADGSMRDSLSILDQVVSFCGKKVDEKEIADILGVINKDIIFSFIGRLKEKDSAGLVKIIREVQDCGYDVRQFCNNLIEQIRNMLIAKVSGNPEELIELSKEAVNEIKEITIGFLIEDIHLLFTIFLKAQEEIRWSPYPWMSLEMAAVKAVHVPSFKSIDKLIELVSGRSGNTENMGEGRVKAKERIQNTEVRSEKTDFQKREDEGLQEPPEKKEASIAGNENSSSINWDELIDKVKEKKPNIGSYLEQGELVRSSEGELTIGFSGSSSFLIDLIEKDDNKKILKNLINDICHRDMHLKFVKISANADSGNSGIRNGAGVDMNPLVKDALDIFGGKLLGVRKIGE